MSRLRNLFRPRRAPATAPAPRPPAPPPPALPAKAAPDPAKKPRLTEDQAIVASNFEHLSRLAAKEWPVWWRLKRETTDLAIELDIYLVFNAERTAQMVTMSDYDIDPVFYKQVLVQGILRSGTHTREELQRTLPFLISDLHPEDLSRELHGRRKPPKGTP